MKRYSLLLFLLLISSPTLWSQSGKIPTQLIVQTTQTIDNGVSDSYDTHLLSESFGIYLLRFKETRKAEQFLKESLLKETYSFIGYNHHITLRDTIPNDIGYSQQIHWNNVNNPRWDVDAESAWELSQGGVTTNGDTIVIALVDDGVDMDHRDLVNQLYLNRSDTPGNGLDDDNNGYVDDYRGWNVATQNDSIPTYDHGTHMAGIIGAQTNNNLDVAGANWNAQIMPVALDTNPTVANLIEAFQYVLDQRALYNSTNGEEGAFIVAMNNSFGLEGFQYESAPMWCDFYTALGEEGIISVGATSNNIIDVDVVGDLPTLCPSDYLIMVGSVDNTGKWYNSAFSDTHIDIAAPGELVFTTYPDNLIGPVSNTSAATAITTGLVGLIYATQCETISDLSLMDPSEASLLVKESIMNSGVYNEYLKTKTLSGRYINYENSLIRSLRSCDTCVKTTELITSLVEDTLIITPSPAGDSLIWLRRSLGEIAWDTLGPLQGDSLILPTGLGCNRIEVALINYCDTIPSLISETFDLSEFSDCVQCEADYCIPQTIDQTDYWMDQLLINNEVEVYTGPDLGYAQYTDDNTFTFVTNIDNSIRVNYVKTDTFENYYFRVWMDVDHNGSFDENEYISETVTSSVSLEDSTVLSLDIPFTSIAGITRMRIGMSPNMEDLLPCGKIDGDAIYEDYCVNIVVEDPFCPLVDSVKEVMRTAQTISVRSFPEVADDEGLNVRYRRQGTSEWTVKAHGSGIFVMEDLEGPCTNYEVQVRRVCEFDTSAYSETLVVQTLCENSTFQIEAQELALYPNPFFDKLTIYQIEQPGTYNVSWMDLNGKIIQEGQQYIESGTRIHPPKSMQPGTYIIRMINKEQTYVAKVIKF